VTTTRIILKRGRASPLWHGHPWVYSGAVERTEGQPEPGDLVEVCDAEGRLIGRGLINPRSQIVVRLLTRKEEPLDPERPEAVDAAALAVLIRRRIDDAVRLRRRLGLPSAETDAFRLVNSEGDGLPGLIVDRYGGAAAIQFTTLGLKRNEAAVFEALAALPEPPDTLVEVAAAGVARVEGFPAVTRVVRGQLPEGGAVTCREAGVRLRVDPTSGQKTGMFLDQRENRVLLGRLAAGASVLDVYSYAGGFALQALRHGARAVTCVDSSARALERARTHAELNGLPGLTTVEADAFRVLEGVTPYAHDIVVVDPPKFARAQKDLPAALKGYRRLNALALSAAAPGGLLATSSCSQLVSAEDFERVVAGAAQDAGRRVTVLLSASQGPDHPVPPAFPEGRYLKFLLLGVR
jgi:23S rRNA (cytosine1962-C5)-methyltransferase